MIEIRNFLTKKEVMQQTIDQGEPVSCPAGQFGARTSHDPQQGQICLPVHLDGMLEQAIPRHAEPCREPEAALGRAHTGSQYPRQVHAKDSPQVTGGDCGRDCAKVPCRV